MDRRPVKQQPSLRDDLVRPPICIWQQGSECRAGHRSSEFAKRQREWTMSRKHHTGLPAAFKRLAWSNLAAQSAEQIGLAATPIVAVLAFGAHEGATGALQTAQTLPFLLASIPAGVMVDRTSRAQLMASAE